MKKYFLLALLCLQALTMSADVVKGRVVDADSGEPLPDAKVQILMQEVGTYYAYMFDMAADSIGQFQWTVGGMSKVNVTINYFGYETLKKSFNCAGGDKDTLDIGDLRMKMSSELLAEVVVKAKVKRFVMKGDTVVFNPEAFNLDDGARVADLVQKLPGVSVKEGKLYFMDKEVHLKINGHDAADDFLTGQLPAEAVQNIKAYEKKSELAELSGMNDGQEQQVLDIVIKPGFMDKWYGQTKLSAYSSKNYRASANLHYLSDHDPVNLYLRASDCGTKTSGVWGDYESDWGDTPQRQQYGKFSYRHNWKPEWVKTSYEDNWNIATSPGHNDTYQNMWQNTETFLDGKSSSFSNSHDYMYNHYLDLPLETGTELHLGPKTSFSFDVKGGAKRHSSSMSNEQETYQSETYSEKPQELVNSSKGEKLDRTEGGYVGTRMRLSHVLKNGDFYVSLTTDFQKDRGSSASHTDYNYQSVGKTETLEQSANTNSNLFQTIFDTKINYQLIPKKLKIGVGYWIDYWRKDDDSEGYRNGTYDFANSFDRMKYYLVNEPRVEMEADLGKVWMKGGVKIQNVGEHFDYQRGKLDTVVHRNTWFPRPGFEFKWQSSKTTQVRGNVSWDYHVADLLGGLDYTDDTNPLNIIKGNPNLKASSELRSGITYSMMFTQGQQMLSFNANYRRVFTPATQVRAYNPGTGVYTVTTANVDDQQRFSAGVNYDRALGELFRLRHSSDVSFVTSHGIKTMSSLSDPWQQFRENSTAVTEYLGISFLDGGWEASVNGWLTYNGISYSDRTMMGQNLWDYRIYLNGKYKMKHWTFGLNGRLLGNAGYISDMMNRNRFGLDASITWKMLKTKGQLTLEAKDILNQMEQVNSNITPTMRTEFRTETFHRYISLTFTYNFDAKVKKDRR